MGTAARKLILPRHATCLDRMRAKFPLPRGRPGAEQLAAHGVAVQSDLRRWSAPKLPTWLMAPADRLAVSAQEGTPWHCEHPGPLRR